MISLGIFECEIVGGQYNDYRTKGYNFIIEFEIMEVRVNIYKIHKLKYGYYSIHKLLFLCGW